MSAGSAARGVVCAPFSPSLFFSAFAPLMSITSSSSDLRLVRTMDDISSLVEPPSGLDEDPPAQAVARAWLFKTSAASGCEPETHCLSPFHQRDGGSHA